MFVDTPGFNDASLDDQDNYLQITESLSIMLDQHKDGSGLACILQIVQLDNSGRIRLNEVEYMRKILQSLTFTHSDFNSINKKFPKIAVLLTKFSKEGVNKNEFAFEGVKSN